MNFQRKPTSFGPKQYLSSTKKPPGTRMMKIHKEVQRSMAFMSVRVHRANRIDDVENIGYAHNGKTYGSSKFVHASQGDGNGVDAKQRKYPLGDNVAMANGNPGPLGKIKELAASPSAMDLGKSSMPSSFRDSSSGANRIAKKPLHTSSILCGQRKVVSSSRGLTSSVEVQLVPNKAKVVAPIQQNVVGRRVMMDKHHKEQSFIKVKEHKTPCSTRKPSLGTKHLRGNLDVHRRIEASYVGNNMKRKGGLPGEDSRTDNEKVKSKGKALLEKRPGKHTSGIEDTKTVRVAKRRKYIGNDEDDMSGDDQNLISGDERNIAGVDDSTDGLTMQTAIVEQYGSLPIDEPIWSGMLKTGSEDYVSLEAHLLAKSCEKVWECSRSLRPMVQVTKLSRFEAEPKSFRASSPTEDNIGLYFFSRGMRPNEDYDKLVKEVIDNDLILRAIVDEAEMLIFPSILLPERHQTFQGKHYLWGLFKRREDREEQVPGSTSVSSHEKENGNQGCSRPCVGQKGIDKERKTASLARSNTSTRPAADEIATLALAATATASDAPRSTRPDEGAAAEAATPAPAVMSHAPSSTRPAKAEAATAAPAAAAAATSGSSSAVPHAGVYGFLCQPTSDSQFARMQQLLEDMVRAGAQVFAMRGDTIGFGTGGQ